MANIPTTIGRMRFNSIVPPEFREGLDDSTPVDSKVMDGILQRIAEKKPDLYKDVSFQLMKLGGKSSTETPTSFSLSDLDSPIDKNAIIAEMDAKADLVRNDPTLPEKEKEKRLTAIYGEYGKNMTDLSYNAALAKGNNLAHMVASGARGNKSQLNSNIGFDGLVLDYKDRPVPLAIKHSYSEGLSPAEYFATAYGTRKGLVATKLSTADSGYYSKQLSYAAADIVVTEDDCGTSRGVRVDSDDKDNIGGLLARPVAGFDAGTIVTPKVSAAIKKQGVDKIFLRSASTCQAHQGGICSRCAGVRERGYLPATMDNIGLAAASALGEPLSQGQLCLGGDTFVRMSDGSKKCIKEIQEGDMVMGSDAYGDTFPVKVLRRYDNGKRLINTYVVKSLADPTHIRKLECTGDHKILCFTGGYKDVVSFSQVPAALVSSQKKMCIFLTKETSPGGIPAYRRQLNGYVMHFGVLSAIIDSTEQDSYDIEVDHPDHLFVLDNGLIVSNSTKHSAGVASANKGLVGGFKLINQLSQVPESFQDSATVANADGRISKIEDAPQGGKFVFVGEEPHYVPVDKDLLVKAGDEVEAGDVMSGGIPNPAEIVKHKGIGAGRLHFVNALKSAFEGSGLPASRRNIEVVSRGIVNHVRVTDPDGLGDWLPDDVVSYSDLERSYLPREGSKKMPPKQAVGKYLEAPALHYTIGTRITPRVAKDLDEAEEKELTVFDQPPGFEPEMIRLQEASNVKQDWMAKMYGTNLKKQLLKSVHSGNAKSDIHGIHPIPGIAYGQEFGNKDYTGKPSY